jgi:hypothetical protein
MVRQSVLAQVSLFLIKSLIPLGGPNLMTPSNPNNGLPKAPLPNIINT